MARTRKTLPARADVAHLISAGVLASVCPRTLIEEVLADTGRASQRERLLPAPSRKLGGIEAIAAQPGPLLAVSKGVGFGQKAQLLRRTEAAPCPLFQLRIGSNLGRGG